MILEWIGLKIPSPTTTRTLPSDSMKISNRIAMEIAKMIDSKELHRIKQEGARDAIQRRFNSVIWTVVQELNALGIQRKDMLKTTAGLRERIDDLENLYSAWVAYKDE